MGRCCLFLFFLLTMTKTGMQYVLLVLELPLLCCRALKLCGSGGPPHAKLVIEWENKTKEWWVYLLFWERAFIFTLSVYYSLLFRSLHSAENVSPTDCNCLCLSAVCLAASRKRWWKMQRAWGISSSSTCSSIAVPWTSASSCIPKKNRWETAAGRSWKEATCFSWSPVSPHF